ncbi:MAG: hypothetical protein QOE45_660 [Frankiaceae bacterium]|jgi:hypothetical protein|nr:hypothetical protein [Frankiaceae bacterium]
MSARLRTTLAAVAGVVALAGPAFAAPPAPDCHGFVLTDPAGDQFIGTSANTLVRPTTAIDVTGAFLLGSGAAQTVNIQISNLTTSPNTEYTFTWDDPVNFGAYYELHAAYLTASGAAGAGDYTLWHYSSPGGSFSLVGTSGAAFTGTNGVVQISLPAGSTTFPATLTNVKVDAVQYEFNVLTDVALRRDTASKISWTQPC